MVPILALATFLPLPTLLETPLPTPLQTPDSVYATPTLRALVARAAENNRHVPAELRAYHALTESEAAFIVHMADGEELSGQIEQIATRLTWRRDGSYEQRVIGHRVQALGPSVSVLTYLRGTVFIPILYGERLLIFAPDSTPSAEAASRNDERPRKSRPTYESIHPFSEKRDAYYRFEGGDTVAVVHLPERTVTLVRVRVTPRRPPERRALLFAGDIDIDAERHHIVRMRGRLVFANREAGLGARLLGRMLRPFAFVELENAEFDGHFWLPNRQRIELQALSPLLSSGRGVVRIVTRFREHGLELSAASDDPGADPGAARADSATGPRFRLTFAPADSIAGFDDWSWAPGAAVSPLSARDFDDVAPPDLRPSGRPQLRFGVSRVSDAFRYNRVEGLYTGVGATLAFRDAAPGLTLHGHAGWAWAAGTPRGALELSLRRGAWETTARAARDLAHTNDFATPWERGGGLIMLFGAGDDYDYLDRHDVTLALTRSFARGDSRLRLEAGVTDDRPERRRLLRGPFGGDTLRPNRPVDPGRYALTRLTLEHGRSVHVGSLRPGLGATLILEHAAGDLAWRRLEGRLHLRTGHGPWTFAARLDAGIVDSDAPPPQTLYEIGTATTLPGYRYKEFAGDRAALLRGTIRYDPGLLDTPIRLGGLILPGLSPAPAVQWHAGWTDASDAAAPIVQALGSRPTGGIRSSIDVLLTFFGGSIGFGLARPLDRHDDWSFVFAMGAVH
jgi:hypothetical protein